MSVSSLLITTSGNGQAWSSASPREQGKMEKTGCKMICGAPTNLAVKGLMTMTMMKTDFPCLLPCSRSTGHGITSTSVYRSLTHGLCLWICHSKCTSQVSKQIMIHTLLPVQQNIFLLAEIAAVVSCPGYTQKYGQTNNSKQETTLPESEPQSFLKSMYTNDARIV